VLLFSIITKTFSLDPNGSIQIKSWWAILGIFERLIDRQTFRVNQASTPMGHLKRRRVLCVIALSRKLFLC
jgi:hypothetical protein